MVNEREEIRRQVREIVGNHRVVRWTEPRITKGDFPGRDWALHIFDVPSAERRELIHRLWGMLTKLWEEKHVALSILFHTPENTDRYYSWVRQEHAAEPAGAT
jgi:hypothetical protein